MNKKIKTNEEILIEFGKLLVGKSFDWSLSDVENLRTFSKPLLIKDPPTQYLKSLSSEEYDKLLNFLPHILITQLIGVLHIFESDTPFRLIYKEDGNDVDLASISEGLSTEVATEYGWVSQFSKLLTDQQRLPPLLALPQI